MDDCLIDDMVSKHCDYLSENYISVAIVLYSLILEINKYKCITLEVLD